jgi:hypothetical protein
MQGCYSVKGDGKGGGISLYWEEGITLEILSFSLRHIDAHISGGPYERKWRGTFVYGEPKVSERHNMWTLLRRLKPRSLEPWMIMGDFNEAMWHEEHFSCSKRSERLMMDFQEVLSHCDVFLVGFTGTPWTFDNKQKGDRNVKVRLDRVVASTAWSAAFPDFRLRHIVSSRSDHCPILLAADDSVQGSGAPIRRYEVAWEPSLAATAEEAWSRRVPGQDRRCACCVELCHVKHAFVEKGKF